MGDCECNESGCGCGSKEERILPVEVAKRAKELLAGKAEPSVEELLKAVQTAGDEYNAREQAKVMQKLMAEVLGA